VEAAENILKEGLKALPSNIDLLYSLGVIYEKTNRFTESVREMEAVLKIDPNNAEVLNFIGYSYADRGMNLEEAEKMIIQALKIKPGNGYMIDSLGWVYFKQNKLDSAVKKLKEAVELMPNDAAIVEHLGDVYAQQNKVKEALEMYQRALKIDPKNSSLQKKLEDINKPKTH
jgi:Flp pilus assembly protein TadD